MDRNVNLRVVDGSKSSSLSARRAWIEIIALFDFPVVPAVALRKESVDRNCGYIRSIRKGTAVALRKESVDRNLASWSAVLTELLSLSARRAWIEISGHLVGVYS